jgi:hypothetical protein
MKTVPSSLEVTMIKLGMRMKTYGTESLTRQNWSPQPTAFPDLPEGHYVVCGLGEGRTERLFVAETFEDMERLHDAYRNGAGTSINWYTGHEVIRVVGGKELLG